MVSINGKKVNREQFKQYFMAQKLAKEMAELKKKRKKIKSKN